MNIQHLYDNVEKARKVLSCAQKVGGKRDSKSVRQRKSQAMGVWNEHYNALRQAQRGGKAQTYSEDFETKVAGIPCGVVVTHYTNVSGWSSNPAMAEEDDHDFEFMLVNARGYHIEWLERKLTSADIHRIEVEYLAWSADQ